MSEQGKDLPTDHWLQVKEVFSGALASEPEARAAFLDQACAGRHAAVRREVEGLLAAHRSSDGFLETPAAVLGTPLQASALEVGQVIGRYRVLGLLGAGGMGQVYLAEDPRLGRQVALKLLPGSFSGDADRLGRFEQEAQAASALSHPNVCVIYEIGETRQAVDTGDVRHFIAMEYVPGESLRQLLERHRASGTRLDLLEIIDIGEQVASGLAAAHAAGVIHRDVKPENVIVRPDGLVKVLDFGLAKRAPGSSPKPGEAARQEVGTEPGMVLGTVQYMSPEQARGLVVDIRTDVWSLGAVLYELLSGRPAFEGETASDVMVAVLEREPRLLAAHSPLVPHDLERVIARCLTKNRADRYQNMSEIAAALRRVRERLGHSHGNPDSKTPAPGLSGSAIPSLRPSLASGRKRRLQALLLLTGTCLLFGLGALFSLRQPRDEAAPVGENASGPPRLAVLPFENVGDTSMAYFAEGITDEVRGKLAALPGLEVIARSSSSQYAKSGKTLEQIGRELEVRYLLTATVRWQKDPAGISRVRVSPELIEASTASARWQQPFDASLTDVFRVQSQIADEVARSLEVALGGSSQDRLLATPTTDIPAYDAYLRGQEVRRENRDDPSTTRRAVRFYEQAVERDSTFLEAWSALASARIALHNAGTYAENREVIRRTAERVLALATDRPQGRIAMGFYYLVVEGDPAKAAAQFAEGLRIAPNDPDLLAGAAEVAWSLGRSEQAAAQFQEFAALDPRNPSTLRRLGEMRLRLKQYEEARHAYDRALALVPTDFNIMEQRAMVELAEGNLAAARAVLRRAPSMVDSNALVAFVALYWDLGWLLDDHQQRLVLGFSPAEFDDDRIGWGLALAQVHALRGNQRQARAYADSARLAAEVALRVTPDDALLHSSYGVALAYLGRAEEAVREGELGVALYPMSKDVNFSPYHHHLLARIYTLVDQPEPAIERLTLLLKMPYFLSPGWLRIDPTFDRLRGDPRFDQLLQHKLER